MKTNWAVDRAVDWTVYGAVGQAVNGAMFWAVHRDVGGAVFWVVYRAVHAAVYRAESGDPLHPALNNFLTSAGTETS